MILLKREEAYLSWFTFLLIATLFTTGMHYFYNANIYFISVWIIQIIMLLFFNSKIRQGSRNSFLFYPLSSIVSLFFMIKIITPYFTYNVDNYLKKTDNLLLFNQHFLEGILNPVQKWIPLSFFISIFYFFVILFFSLIYYTKKVSLYKTQRFYNGLFSLIGSLYIIFLFFPVKNKNIVSLHFHDISLIQEYISQTSFDNIINITFLLSGFFVAIYSYILFSFFRDSRKKAAISFLLFVVFSFGLIYFHFIYFSFFIFNIFMAILFFKIAADGFVKFTSNN